MKILRYSVFCSVVYIVGYVNVGIKKEEGEAVWTEIRVMRN